MLFVIAIMQQSIVRDMCKYGDVCYNKNCLFQHTSLTKTIPPSLSSVSLVIPRYNIFDHLKEFKENIIKYLKLVSKEYHHHKYYTDIFFRWYITNFNRTYIPITFDVTYDLTYQKNNYSVSVDDIQNYINEKLVVLQRESWFATNRYKHYDVLSCNQIDIIKRKYKNNVVSFEDAKNVLCELFHFLDNTGNIFCIPPWLINRHNMFELFGSSVNSQNNYCSPFDIDKQCFGSHGDFFEFKMTNGCYIANPPFDYHFISKVIDRLISELDRKKLCVDVVIVIPNWSDVVECCNKINKYVVMKTIIRKDEIKFYDHTKNKCMNIIDCCIIHVANHVTKFKLYEFVNDWKKVK